MIELRIKPNPIQLRIKSPVQKTLGVTQKTTLLRIANKTVVSYTSGSIVTVTAGGNLGGHRAVVIDSGVAEYASNAVANNATRVYGITTGAVSSGASGSVQTFGEMTEPSFTWTPGLPIYLSSNGQLTQTVPTSGFVLQLATAVTATKIFIAIQVPITLS